MLELERHIEILLLTNDCVIVPGLGGFMAHHVDARYDEQDSTFIPPLRTLGFNPQLKLNDSLLVQSYIEAYDISYPVALRRIEGEVEELWHHLEAEGSYELNSIGVLSFNDEGNLLFSPCEAGILTPGYYGLSAFEMPTCDIPAETVTLTHTEVNKPKHTDDTITIKMSWLRNAVAVAAAIIAFLMIGSPVANDRSLTEVTQSSFIPVSSLHRQVEATVEQHQEESADNELITEDVEVVEENIVDEPSTTEASNEFGIIMASHVSEHNATLFIEQMKEKGYYDARIWTNHNNVRRVVYGSYASRDDAENTLRQLRSESKLFKNTWIMEIDE